jgi:hypothetical protein
MTRRLSISTPDRFYISTEDHLLERELDDRLEKISYFVHCYVQTEFKTNVKWIQVYDWSEENRRELFVHKTVEWENVFQEIEFIITFL